MNPQQTAQNELPLQPSQAEPVKAVVLTMLGGGRQPSAWELLAEVEAKVGLKARWDLLTVLEQLAENKELIGAWRSYCCSMRASDDLGEALRGAGAPKEKITSTIDSLLQQSKAYRGARSSRTW